MVGSLVNHYRIVRKLGAGGMGEVYEAEDTRLNRRVALKVLPRQLAADPERRERFEREARAVAALNHPNIVTIHSVEESDAGPILAMELIDGQSLDALIPRGGMAVPTLLATGTAIASAVAAAQQRGITHRDLKPANVMVTRSGQVKVLDFGLARLHDESLRAQGDAATRLATSGLTGEGRIVGTVAYMSPEQAEGRPVDSRSDIFSMGVLLHEMATGTRPFAGDTPVSIISSIIKDTPTSVTNLRVDLPAELARIIKRCLAKEPDRRYQSALDLRNDLEELASDLQSGASVASGVRPAARGPSTAGRRGRLLVGSVALVAMAVTTWIGFRAWSAAERELPSVSLANMRVARLTSTGSATQAAISPDGKYVVHVGRDGTRQSLWIRQANTTSNVQIVPPAEVRYDGITMSPDSTHVFYSAYEGAQSVSSLYVVPALGGTPRRILEDIDSPVTFSPDGSEFAFVRGMIDPPGSHLLIANADGSNVRTLATTGGDGRFLLERPSWSPDGRHIAVGYVTIGAGGYRGIYVVDTTSGEVDPVGEPTWVELTEVAWVKDGSAIVTSAAAQGTTNLQLWRVDFPSGRATRITNDLMNYAGVNLSADSTALVTVQTETTANIWVMSVDDPSAAHQITRGTTRSDGLPGLAWTPDGRIVFGSQASGNPDIWIMNADGSEAQQLTADEAVDAQLVLCGEGRFIVFTSLRGGQPEVWRVNADGSGPVRLSADGQLAFLPACAPAGDTLFYSSQSDDGQFSWWRVPLEGGEATVLATLQSTTDAISPDGRWIAGPWLDRATRNQVIGVFEPGQPEPAHIVPVFPRPMEWTPDGRWLTYIDIRDNAVGLWRYPLPDGPAEPIVTFPSLMLYQFAWSPDGMKLALARGTTSHDVVLFSVDR